MLTGGQWAVLQSAAWAGMLVEHLHRQTLAVAVAQTFDGQHPCAMCKAIQKQKSSEKKNDFDIKADRIDLLSVAGIEIAPDDDFRLTLVNSDEFSPSFARPPLLRPPRSARI